MPVLLFPNQIFAAAWAHFRGMLCAGRNIAPFSHPISARLAALRQRHFAVEDDVRRLDWVRVVGIKGVWAVLPDVRVKKSFPMQLAFERCVITGHKFCTSASKLYDCFSFGRKIPPAIRATMRRGANRTVSAPSQFVKPDITELFPAASAASPT
jgi:hypothetical protein